VTWLPIHPGGATFDSVFSLCPDAHERFGELYEALWTGGVDASALDACRDRIDARVRCTPDLLDENAWAPDTRLAVRFAEQYALDPHGLTDRDFERLHEHYTDEQIATLVLAAAMFDARARFSVALDVV
jgi:alkylhydroperoxidase family enzyme